MKDFRLSELKAHCDKMFELYGEQACEKCGESEIGRVCLSHFKNGVSGLPKFERRDMLDLPFKECCEHEERGGGFYKTWRVYYRGYAGYIAMKPFLDEREADAFIEKLKGGKK